MQPGRTATIRERVTEAMLATALGSGDVAVLGTPAVVALAEAAAVACVAGALEPGQTTVGSVVEARHTAPTPIGGMVEARAELLAVEGRRLRFRVELSDEAGPVARVAHERVVVDRARFQAQAEGRTAGA